MDWRKVLQKTSADYNVSCTQRWRLSADTGPALVQFTGVCFAGHTCVSAGCFQNRHPQLTGACNLVLTFNAIRVA